MKESKLTLKELKQNLPKVFNIANEYIKQQRTTGYSENTEVDELFVFKKTPQGQQFWEAITMKDFDKAKNLFPDLF